MAFQKMLPATVLLRLWPGKGILGETVLKKERPMNRADAVAALIGLALYILVLTWL